MLSSSGSLSRRPSTDATSRPGHHVVRHRVAKILLRPVRLGDPRVGEGRSAKIELRREERVDLRTVLGGSIRILVAHRLDLAIGPLLELRDLIGRHAEDVGDHEHGQRAGDVVVQVGPTLGTGQHVVDQLVDQAHDVALHPFDHPRGEPLLDETAIHRVVGRVAEQAPGHREPRRLAVVAGPRLPVAQHRAHVLVAGHREERRIESLEPMDRTLLAQLGVRGERVGEHLGAERVVVDRSHAANVPNRSSYDRCVELAERIADTDAFAALDAAHAAACEAVDHELLAICRDRVAMLLRHGPTLDAMTDDDRTALSAWPTSDRYSARDKAALAFTEQYIIDVASLTDAQAADLCAHLDDEGFVTFVNALLVIEQRMTLELAFDRVLS